MTDRGRARARAAQRLLRAWPAAVEVLLIYAAKCRDLNRQPLEELLEPGALRRRVAGPASASERDLVEWLVEAILGRWPFRATCLVRALVLKRLLERRGVAARIQISVRHRGQAISAHAVAIAVSDGEEVSAVTLVAAP
jgi:hypothetical protein